MKPIHTCTTCKGANLVTLSQVYSNKSSIRKVVSKLTDYHILHNCLSSQGIEKIVNRRKVSAGKRRNFSTCCVYGTEYKTSYVTINHYVELDYLINSN